MAVDCSVTEGAASDVIPLALALAFDLTAPLRYPYHVIQVLHPE